ncbi:hypothetical protein FRC17_006947, partial [Serendipita sp. 399]
RQEVGQYNGNNAAYEQQYVAYDHDQGGGTGSAAGYDQSVVQYERDTYSGQSDQSTQYYSLEYSDNAQQTVQYYADTSASCDQSVAYYNEGDANTGTDNGTYSAYAYNHVRETNGGYEYESGYADANGQFYREYGYECYA